MASLKKPMIWLLLTASMFVLWGCSSGGGDSFDEFKGFRTDNCSINVQFLADGGPQPDGIPAILNPVYGSLADVLESRIPAQNSDRTLVVEINGQRRAYLQRMLWNHEIINDTLGGVPIVVSYCPLTGSTVVFERRADEAFRVSGLLYQSNLVMYDSTSNSLWPQMNFEATCGDRVGAQLAFFKVQEMSFGRLSDFYPEIEVVIDAQRTQFGYTTYPYGNYDVVGNEVLLFDVPNVDTSYPIKMLVTMVPGADGWRGYPHLELAAAGVVNDNFDNRDIVTFYDESGLYANVFDREVNGSALTFDLVANGSADQVGAFLMRDRETGSVWNLLGQAVSGPLTGSQLEEVLNMNAMWFSFKASLPDASVYQFNAN